MPHPVFVIWTLLIAFLLFMRWRLNGSILQKVAWRKHFKLWSLSHESMLECDVFLSAHSSYYRLLSEEEKKKYIRRTLYVMDQKTFVERDEVVLTEQNKMQISATLVQLTFGLNYQLIDLPHFEFIVVYPDQFHSKLVGAEVHGLTVGNGQLFLSWNNFQKGHEISNDKLNLGLHEFAHALEIELRKLDHYYMQLWHLEGGRVIEKIVNDNKGVFRKYSSTNIHELWACAVETFFESPQEFEEHYPILYDRTCAVLGQDHLKRITQRNLVA